MAKGFSMTPQQKEEFRRLTQKANRRIAKAFREYEKEGLKLVPKALTGGFVQSKKQWSSQKYALSRSVTQFSSRKDYLDYMRKLRQFDVPEYRGGVPTYTEYEEINTNKLKQAMRTALGREGYRNLPPEIQAALDSKIDNMTVQQQSIFWKIFEDKAAKMGMKYASGDAFERAIDEMFFKEDIKPMIINSIVASTPGLSKQEEMEYRRKLKYYKNDRLVKELNKKR